jgi:hypothetical protein
VYLLAPEFLLGLSGAKQVGRKFRAAHVIKYLLRLLQPFALVDLPCAKASI